MLSTFLDACDSLSWCFCSFLTHYNMRKCVIQIHFFPLFAIITKLWCPFIPIIYNAPLRENYSSMLRDPTTNSKDFGNLSFKSRHSYCSETVGAAQVGLHSRWKAKRLRDMKALCFLTEVRTLGTKSSPWIGCGGRVQTCRTVHNQRDYARQALLACRRCVARLKTSAKHRAFRQWLWHTFNYDQ